MLLLGPRIIKKFFFEIFHITISSLFTFQYRGHVFALTFSFFIRLPVIFPDSEFPGYPEVDGVEDDDGETVDNGGNVAEDSTDDILESLLWFRTFLVNWFQTYKNDPGTESKILTQNIKIVSF